MRLGRYARHKSRRGQGPRDLRLKPTLSLPHAAKIARAARDGRPGAASFSSREAAMRINGAKSGFCTNFRQVELDPLRLALISYNQAPCEPPCPAAFSS